MRNVAWIVTLAAALAAAPAARGRATVIRSSLAEGPIILTPSRTNRDSPAFHSRWWSTSRMAAGSSEHFRRRSTARRSSPSFHAPARSSWPMTMAIAWVRCSRRIGWRSATSIPHRRRALRHARNWSGRSRRNLAALSEYKVLPRFQFGNRLLPDCLGKRRRQGWRAGPIARNSQFLMAKIAAKSGFSPPASPYGVYDPMAKNLHPRAAEDQGRASRDVDRGRAQHTTRATAAGED
jgi:hypothetical protein